MKISLFLAFILCLPLLSIARPNDALFTAILKTHVKNGRVNYSELKKDGRLARYCKSLESTDPASLKNADEQLAFWINAYNAYTLKIVVDNYPVKSIKDIGSIIRSVWRIPFVPIGPRTMTLDDIEHGIIRKQFKEPMIHFALVCAARSCPPLREEAYKGQSLKNQLEDQGKRFLRNQKLNRFDLPKRQAYLSSILKWYREDFPSGDRNFFIYLSRFAPQNAAASLSGEPALWSVRYLGYDWSLNDR